MVHPQTTNNNTMTLRATIVKMDSIYEMDLKVWTTDGRNVILLCGLAEVYHKSKQHGIFGKTRHCQYDWNDDEFQKANEVLVSLHNDFLVTVIMKFKDTLVVNLHQFNTGENLADKFCEKDLASREQPNLSVRAKYKHFFDGWTTNYKGVLVDFNGWVEPFVK